jgi:hypothetical protein
VRGTRRDGKLLAGTRDELLPPEPKAYRAIEDLKALLLIGVDVAAATNPSGLTDVSKTTASPPVSIDVFRKRSRSPVMGFSSMSPA